MNFYYGKRSSSVAAHILLEEVGAQYRAIEVDVSNGEHRAAEFLARNPKGRVPLLETAEGFLSENPAILEYIAATHPAAKCAPTGDYALAQARALCAYLCATAHVAYAHGNRGGRWATQAASLADMQSLVAGNMTRCAAFIEAEYPFAPWVLGAAYSFCDPYVFQFGRWLTATGVKIRAYPKLADHYERMQGRPATRIVLAQHDLSPSAASA